jgi:hypothetical protein
MGEANEIHYSYVNRVMRSFSKIPNFGKVPFKNNRP